MLLNTYKDYIFTCDSCSIDTNYFDDLDFTTETLDHLVKYDALLRIKQFTVQIRQNKLYHSQPPQQNASSMLLHY